jgi:hypothetical protein
MDPQGQTGITFGSNNRFGNVTVSGPVAGGDVHIGPTTETLSAQQVIELIRSLQQEVDRLDGAPAGEREDARDELDKARRAAEEGDQPRLAKKLESARSILEGLGSALPSAVALANTVASLLTQVGGAV